MNPAQANRVSSSPATLLALWLERTWVQQTLLFVACLFILLRTIVPTLYTLDSAELATGVATLGIVHAPGYPLYLLTAHLFTALPVGELAYRINLFSAFCLALSAPATYGLIRELISSRLIALCTALTLVWSYYVWATGIITEVYAPQLLTLSLCGWLLAAMYRRRLRSWGVILPAGVLVGIAVAMAPSSILFAPGIAVAFGLMRIPWKRCMATGLVSIVVFCAPLVYFPVRYVAHPALNMAGQYNADGSFQPVDLQSIQGIWWILRSAQFGDLFFSNGYLPDAEQLQKVANWFWGNYLGVGLIVGLIGVGVLAAMHRKLLIAWLTFFVPYTYFYTAYGAVDRETMFGPSYLLWAIVFAYGLRWATQSVSVRAKAPVLLALPAVVLAINFPLLDASRDTTVRAYSEALVKELPPNALVFGVWWDIAPLQYLQIVEGQRPDLKLLNTFLFEKKTLATFVDACLARQGSQGPPVIFLSNAIMSLDPSRYQFSPLALNRTLPARSGDENNSQIIRGGFYVTK